MPQEGNPMPHLVRQVVPIHDQVVSELAPIIVPNVEDDTPLARGLRESIWTPELEDAFGHTRSWIGVPLLVHEHVIGMLALRHNTANRYHARHAELALAFASQAAVAIENARLYRQAQELAAFEERQRLARDLHDAVSQTLFSTTMIADVLPRLWERSPEEGRRRLDELRRLTHGAMAEMRILLLELRPMALTEAPLAQLVHQLATALAGRSHLQIDVNVNGDCGLRPDVQVTFYRIVQEALNNAARHARAHRVSLDLECRPEHVKVRVADDGRGFKVTDIPSNHMGLRIMRERAESIGADVEVHSQVGSGTQITVVWPG